MKNLKEMVIEILSKMNKEDIINKLKSAGIDQDNIDTILKLTTPEQDNK